MAILFLTNANGEQTGEITALTGSSVVISCHSSLAPTWQWSNSKNDANKILALSGVNAHPNLDDQRFHFDNQESLYSVSISGIRLSDAGTFTCLGDAYVTTVLNVLR